MFQSHEYSDGRLLPPCSSRTAISIWGPVIIRTLLRHSQVALMRHPLRIDWRPFQETRATDLQLESSNARKNSHFISLQVILV